MEFIQQYDCSDRCNLTFIQSTSRLSAFYHSTICTGRKRVAPKVNQAVNDFYCLRLYFKNFFRTVRYLVTNGPDRGSRNVGYDAAANEKDSKLLVAI
jgi:hypothetical protein